MRNYENFTAWQNARDLSVRIYELSAPINDADKQQLFDQLKQCSLNTMSLIAEGSIRKNHRFIEYLEAASGCVFKCRSALEIARSLQWVHEEVAAQLDVRLRQLGYKIYALKIKLKAPETV